MKWEAAWVGVAQGEKVSTTEHNEDEARTLLVPDWQTAWSGPAHGERVSTLEQSEAAA